MRFAVGIEDADDILKDLEQALEVVEPRRKVYSLQDVWEWRFRQ